MINNYYNNIRPLSGIVMSGIYSAVLLTLRELSESIPEEIIRNTFCLLCLNGHPKNR